MSATVSATSLTQDLQGKLGRNLSDRAMLVGLGGPGSQPDSFSRTLQSQLRNQQSARTETASSRAESAATRTRDTERSPQREAVREPERTSSRTSTASGERAEGDAQTNPNSASPEAPTGKQGDGNSAQQDADQRPEPESDTASAARTDNPDAAAVAGLPAAIAALRAETTTDSREADLLAGDSAGKSLQNAGLLTKSDAGSSNAGQLPDAALQGRLPIAAPALATDKTASALQTLTTEGGEDAIQQPGQASGGHHGTNLFSVLRHSAATTPATPQLPVQTPAGQQAWAEDVGNQVRWMLGRAESKAELVLTPPNLGKLEVSIALNGDQTTAQFVASSQAARDALEQALPRLREILEQAGISLGQANVSTSEDQGAGAEGGGQGQRGGSSETTADTTDGASRTTWLRQHDGLVDTFV
ncbi:Flagellar hook-length control protein fliK [Thauera humireducens]|uniref:flagellar hook-length control protein FliK n=1 Tax=Thauera humireducens TaxID=1134435 RepID=UPI002467A70E|nr:flagellar hook-length control protein FliK [Thauera humireducens]CAH1745250.1 Flagellar hook-length control protein fliK [Thauera humireducens]